MREIKFRGYDTESKCWRYGYYMQKNDTILCMATPKQREENEHHLIIYSEFCDWNMPLPYHQSEVDKKSIGQYTGLKDKNEKEIYEGDIVKLISDSYRECEFEPFIARYIAFRSGSFYITDNATSRFRWEDYQVEVVGNIYENPELLG